MSYRAIGAEPQQAAPTAPSGRLVRGETALVYRVGEEKYARIVELQRRHLERVRLDWRFWVGLGMAAMGTSFLIWRPDIGAARKRAGARIGKVAEPVVEKVT